MDYFSEYKAINDFYSDRCAKRSGVPLMNHINEGLKILSLIGASIEAKRAFCLHPIVQNDEPVDVSWSTAYELALEYKQKANSYLCRPQTDWIKTVDDLQKVVGTMSKDCADMLWADKIQNQKDFLLYHKDSHVRSKELSHYFNLWLTYLYKLGV